MFLAYINELIYILKQFGIKGKMFADDVKMYVQIVNCVDMERLQSALSALYDWAKEWQLEISVDKCCVMNIGAENCTHYLTLNNSVLPIVPNIRDLGVIVSNNLTATTRVTESARLTVVPSLFYELLSRKMSIYLSVLLSHMYARYSSTTL